MSPRRHSHTRKLSTHLTENDDLIELWLLRILIPLQGHRKFLNHGSFSDDDVAYALGLESLDEDDDSFDKKSILKILRARYKKVAARHPQLQTGLLAKNIHWLTEALGLSKTEEEILVLNVLIFESSALDTATSWLGGLNSPSTLQRTIADILDAPFEDVREALS